MLGALMTILLLLLAIGKEASIYMLAGLIYAIITGMTWADVTAYITIAGMVIGALVGTVKVLYPATALPSTQDLKSEMEKHISSLETKQNARFEVLEMDVGTIRSKTEMMDKTLEIQKTKTEFLEKQVRELEEDLKASLIRIEDKLDANHDKVVSLLIGQRLNLS